MSASTPTPTAAPLLLTPEAAARSLSLSRARLYELLATGEIPSLKIGRSRRIRADVLAQYVDRLSASAA